MKSNTLRAKILSECKDIIHLTNGLEIKCKVLEITPTEIGYRDCSSGNLTLKTVQLAQVKSIRYENGTVENFGGDVTSQKTRAEYKHPPKTHLNGEDFAAVGYILLGIGALFTLAASLVAGG